MKKYFLLLFFACVFSFLAVSQNLSLFDNSGAIPNNGVVNLAGDTSQTLYAYISVMNNSNFSMDVRVKKIEKTLVQGSDNTFCWGVCYPSTTYVSVMTIRIDPGATCTEFSAEYRAMGHPGLSTVMYVFYNDSNPNDSVCVNVNYNATVGIDEDLLRSQVSFSNVYPNPADERATFRYSLPKYANDARLVVLDLIGTKVVEEKILGKEGKLNLNTANLADGIYFYTLLVDNVRIATRKLVVRH